MIPLINTRNSYQQFKNKLSNLKRKSTFTKFNYNLFKLNENFRDKNTKIGFKNTMPVKKTGNIYLDNMMIIENCSKEKSRKNNKKLSLILKRPAKINNVTNFKTEFNIGLIPKRVKNFKCQNFNSLISENNKTDLNYIDLKSLERKEDLKRNLNINIQNPNFNEQQKTSNHSTKKEDDNFSDCQSLKGIMLDIKKKIKENKYNVNKIFGEFDKQIIQEQYLVERFYEMKKNDKKGKSMNKLRQKLKNQKLLTNFDKILYTNNTNKFK